MRRALSMVIALVLGALPMSATSALATPTYPGDLEPTFVGWFDAAGDLAVATPGTVISARYTVTNTLTYPVRITAVDSELTGGPCVADFQREDRSTDVAGEFPLTLEPGETSRTLTDIGFRLSSQSSCASSSPTWMGNVVGERATASPSPVTPSVVVRTATVAVTQTTTVTESHRADLVPFVLAAGIGALVVAAGAVLVVTQARRGRR